MQPITCGRIVKVRVEDKQYRPGIVVQKFDLSGDDGYPLINVIVFLDGSNDASVGGSHVTHTGWYTSIKHGTGVSEWLWPNELDELLDRKPAGATAPVSEWFWPNEVA